MPLMPASVPTVRRCSLLVAASLLVAVPTAHAQRVSARDKAKVDAIEQRMATAEKRYTDALLLVANADPKGTAEGNAALEDMEDVITACPQWATFTPETAWNGMPHPLHPGAERYYREKGYMK